MGFKLLKSGFVLYFFFMCIAAYSLDGRQYVYTQLSSDRFIPKANCIYKEDLSYVWIGTSNGLYRFDGFEYKCYTSSLDSKGQIPGDFIFDIFKDSHGLLWIMTNNGAGIYNSEKDIFDSVIPEGINDTGIYSFCETENGLYFGGVNKLYKYNYESHRLNQYYSFSFPSPYHVRFIGKLSEDRIVLSNAESVASMNLSNCTFEDGFIELESKMSSIFTDSSARTWVAYYNKGLKAFDCDGREMFCLNKDNSRLSHEAILCMEQQDSLLWIGTDGGGVNILNTLSNEITVLSHTHGNSNSFPSNSVVTLHSDGNGAMWVGSLRDGIINIQKGYIKSYGEAPDGSPYGLSNPTVISLYDDSESLWIGTDGRGVNRFDFSDKTFTHYPFTDGYKVVSIAEYSEDELILSFYLQGFYLLNKKSGKISKFNITDKYINRRMYYTATSVNLYNEGKDNILFISDKLQRYNKSDKSVKLVKADGNDIANGYFLPVGRYNDCLYFYDENSIYKLSYGDSSMCTIYKTNEYIHSASVSESGNLWIALDCGILVKSLKDNSVKTLEKVIDRKNVSSIIEGKNDLVWIGAEDKLYGYLQKDNSFVQLGISQGVKRNEFLRKSNLITKDGTVCIGGNNGLLVIDNNFKIDSNEHPSVVLTDITVDGKSVMKGNGMKKEKLELQWNDKFLEVSVMSLENDILRPKKFRFEVVGTNSMVLESEQPLLKLNSLLQGSNSIFVSCSTQKGLWTKPVELVTLYVMPPWYRTWWFLLICVLVMFIIVASVFYSMLRRKENVMKLALKEHERILYEEKVRFLINMSHELRTPLTLIHAPLKRILDKMGNNSDNFVELNKIYHQSERMKKLLDMVLDLRKLEMGEDIIHVGKYPVNKWVMSVVDEFILEGEAQGIGFKVELDDRINFLYFDKDKLEIVLTNLIVNAIKHSYRGGEIVVKTEFVEDETAVRFSVIDCGVGIKDIDIDKLFTRFYQGSNEKYGTGIGLSYSKVLVELHNGSISAGNNENTPGAHFFFTIPLAICTTTCVQEDGKAYLNEILVSDEDSVTIDETEHLESYDTSDTVVLFVDDSIELLEFMVEALQSRFGKVLTAANGKEAIAVMSKTIPDLIVSDVMMPKMNGYELCSYIKKKQEFCNIPIILLTAMAEKHSEKYGYKIGAEAFLPKPFEIDTLYELIRVKLKVKEQTKHYYMQLSNILEVEKVSGADEVFLRKLNAIINDNISNNELDINFICKKLVMSRSSFYNKLKLVTDITGNEYIHKIRIEYAISLMKATELNFTEIAEKSGFTSSRYFSTIFKQYTGMTPTQYKKSISDSQNQMK